MEKPVQPNPSPPPSPENGAVELADILDVPALQAMMDAFYAFEKIGMAIVDLRGRVLVATGWQDICTKFHRVHPETRRHCVESDVALSAGIAPGAFKLYRCQNNLWDMATPIVVGGRHMGNLFLGQFFFDDELPDAEIFRAQARRYGFDEAEYLAALDRVPRWSREKVDRAMTFYAHLATQISTLGYRNLQSTQALGERQRVDEQLRLHAQMLDGVTESVVASDLEGRILYWGRGAEKLYGYAADEVLGKPYRDFAGAIAPPDEEAFRKEILAKGSWQGEHVQRNRAGKTFWTATVVSLVRDEQGHPTGYVGIDQDVTERKQAEQALRDSEERFRQVAETAKEWIWEMDADGVYTYSNPVVEHILGYKPEELVGKVRFHELFAPSVREEIRKDAAARSARKEAFRKRVNPVVHKDGRIVVLETTGVPILDPDGHLAGYRGADTDVTERKQAEDALRKSEAQLSNALEMAHAGHWEYDVAADTFTFNDNFYRIFRTTAEEVGGYKMSSAEYARRFCHPDDMVLVGEETRKAIESADPNYSRQIEHRILYADGSVGTIAVRFFLVKDAQGRTVKTYGVNQDVTERKQVEKALQESEALHRSILNASPDDITLADLDGRILMVSPSALKMFGYERTEQLIGHPVFEFIVPEDRERAAADVARLHQGVTSGPVGYRSEYRGLRADGTVFDVEVNGEFIRDAAGQPVRMLLIVRDVTDRKRTEEQLRDRERQFKLLFESMSSGFALHEIILDEAGTPCDYRFLQVNPAFEALTGLKADALVGRTVREVLPRTESVWIERYGRVALTGEPVTFENYSVELDRHYQVTAYRPQPGRFAVLVGDVTALKRAQEDLQRKQTMLARTETLAHVGSWEWDVATDTVIWSDELFRIFRRDPAQGAPSFAEHPALYPPDDFRRLNEAVKAALRDGTPYELELRALCLDGAIRTCLAHGQAEQKDGRVVRLSGSFQDVTDRKQAEEQLRDSEIRLAQILETMQETLSVVDADGAFLFANPKAALNLVGGSPAKLIGKNIRELLPADQAETLVEKYRGVISSAQPLRQEVEISLPGGKRWFLNSLHPIAFGPGQTPAVLSLSMDITDRKQAEAALQESERRHRDYLAHSPYGIFVADEQGRFVQVNPAACRITGYSERELLSISVPDLHGEDGRKDAERHFLSVLREGKATGELKFRTKSGELRWWLVSAVKISDARFLGFCNDITDRKQAEEKLQASAERFRDIAANIPGAIYQLQTGRTGALEVPYMSSGCEALFGRPVAGMDFAGLLFDHMHVGDRALFQHSLAKAAKRLERWSLEFRVEMPDGQTKWLRGSANPRSTPQGSVLWNGVLLDITKLKQAVLALREREAFQNLLMDTIPSPVFYKDRQGRYLGFNKAFETLYGKTKSQLVGKSVVDVAPPELAKIYHAKDLELLERPGTQIYEAPMQDAQGGLHDVIFHKASIVDAHGAVAGLIGILLDITERKRAEAEILNLSKFPQENPHPVLRIAQPGTLLYSNPAGQVLLAKWHVAVGGSVPEPWLGWIQKALESAEPGVQEEEAGGRSFSVSISPVAEAGYVNLYALDVSERKAAERQMAQQLDELRRWQTVTLGREGRVAELKREVNALSVRLGQPPPYSSAEDP